MVQKSGIIKRFLAGTYSNQILYLNSVSESEKIEDSKNLCFPENGAMVLLSCGLRFISFVWKQLPLTFSCQIIQRTAKSVLFEALLVPARKISNTKL